MGLENRPLGVRRSVVMEIRLADFHCTHLDTQPSVAEPPAQQIGRIFASSALASKDPGGTNRHPGAKDRPFRLVAGSKTRRRQKYAHVPRFGLHENAPPTAER
jgi:hypothetical protein